MRTTFSPSEIRRMAAKAPALPHDQNRAEVRIMAALITGAFLFGQLVPLLYVLGVPGSVLHQLAGAGYVPPYCVAAAFVLVALAALPHFIAVVFRPDTLEHKLPRRMAALSAFGAATIWLYLAQLALSLGCFGVIPALYVLNIVGCVTVAGLFGFSVNAQQLRERITHDKVAS
jgi:hypothetical protein